MLIHYLFDTGLNFFVNQFFPLYKLANSFITQALSISCIVTVFWHLIYNKHLWTSSFDELFEMSQSQLMYIHVTVCFMSCHFYVNEPNVQKVMAVSYDGLILICLLSVSKDKW